MKSKIWTGLCIACITLRLKGGSVWDNRLLKHCTMIKTKHTKIHVQYSYIKSEVSLGRLLNPDRNVCVCDSEEWV